MSSTILHTQPGDLENAQERRKYTVCIVGCGQNGVLYAGFFGEAGFNLICLDVDQTVTNLLAKGKAPFLAREVEFKLKSLSKSGRLTVTNEIKLAVPQSDIIVVTVPALVDDKGRVNYSNLENTYKKIGTYLKRGSLVIVTSIVGVGITERSIREPLENASGLKAGVDFGLVYSPAQSLDNQSKTRGADDLRIVASFDNNSLNVASEVMRVVTGKNVRKTKNLKAAELAALFDIVKEDVSNALANELASFCEKAGIDCFEAYRLLDLSQDQTSLLAKRDPKEPHLLLESAENLNMKLRMPTIAREINEETVRHAANLTKDALRNSGKTLRRARISLLGVSQTQNMKSPPKQMVKKLTELLESRGAKVTVHDPYFSGEELAWMKAKFKKSLNDALEAADCLVVLTGHDQFKRLNLKKTSFAMKMPAAIVDFEGIFDAEKVEKEGFIYRGLGRGVWTK